MLRKSSPRTKIRKFIKMVQEIIIEIKAIEVELETNQETDLETLIEEILQETKDLLEIIEIEINLIEIPIQEDLIKLKEINLILIEIKEDKKITEETKIKIINLRLTKNLAEIL
jgi:hypothetical protein